MRILGEAWLAALTILPVVVATNPQNKQVIFDNSRFNGARLNDGRTTSAFQIKPDLQLEFQWSTPTGVEIKQLKLFVARNFLSNGDRNGTQIDSWSKPGNIAGTGAEGLTPTTSSVSTVTTTAAHGGTTESPSVDGNNGNAKRRSPNLYVRQTQNLNSLEVNTFNSGGTVKIKNLFPLLQSGVDGLPLYFQAVLPDGKGSSYSRAFTVFRTNTPTPQNEVFIEDAPFAPEESGGKSNGDLGGGISSPPSSTATPSSDRSSSSQGGGLPTGAIAGIAIGAVVILALIGGLIWFFRRRRQAKDADALQPFGPGRTRTDELIAAKEANAGGDIDNSPHSPYSDDGDVIGAGAGAPSHQRNSSSIHHVGSSPVATTAIPAVATAVPIGQSHPSPPPGYAQVVQQPQRGSFPGAYSDHPSASGGGVPSSSTRSASLVAADNASHGGSVETPAGGRLSPHGVATQYAHLVEEGMTEEEIRRLEEEERALDAAIERAGAGRR